MAVTLYEWNPFVAERLVIGHWPVLIAYAALPWVIEGARDWRRSGRIPARLWFLVPLASLSASAGLTTAIALVAFALVPSGSRALRRWVAVALLLAAANAPWLVAGLLHASTALTDPDGARLFGLRGEGSLPAPLAALGLGGIWNAEVVPGSRTSPLAWVALVGVLVLVVGGIGELGRRFGRRDTLALACCWGVGWGLAVLTWALPDQMAWLVGHVPGAGLLRDGSRILALCAPLLAAAGGYGAARLLSRLPEAARPGLVIVLVLLPVATMPDAAFGISGRLSAAQYPEDFSQARGVIDDQVAAGADGDVLLLPFSSYRQPEWNDGHKVLDPVGRFLAPDFVASDELLVSGRRVAGEDPLVREVTAVLARSTPDLRAAGLADLGIGFVVTEVAAGPAPEVTGTTLLGGPDLLVQQLSRPSEAAVPSSWSVAVFGAWLAFASLLLGGVLDAARGLARHGPRRSRAPARDELSTDTAK